MTTNTYKSKDGRRTATIVKSRVTGFYGIAYASSTRTGNAFTKAAAAAAAKAWVRK